MSAAKGPHTCLWQQQGKNEKDLKHLKPEWTPLARPCPSTASLTRPVGTGAQLLPAPRGENVTPGQRVEIRTRDPNRSGTRGGGGRRGQVCRRVPAARAATRVGAPTRRAVTAEAALRGGLVGGPPEGPAGPCTSPLEVCG